MCASTSNFWTIASHYLSPFLGKCVRERERTICICHVYYIQYMVNLGKRIAAHTCPHSLGGNTKLVSLGFDGVPVNGELISKQKTDLIRVVFIFCMNVRIMSGHFFPWTGPGLKNKNNTLEHFARPSI